MLRLAAHRLSQEGFQFSLSFHHAVLDGWSVATLLAELSKLKQIIGRFSDFAKMPAP